MARKFRKKLPSKPIRKKAEPVLSVELIRKETLEKIKALGSRLISFIRNFK